MNVKEVVESLKAIPLNIEEELLLKPIKGFFIDSRMPKEGGLFFAIKGRKVDGHDFVKEAIKKGAIAAVVEREIEGLPCLLVKNTQEALLSLAGLYRRRFPVTIIAVTGTNGKTTTKEMIAFILEKVAPTVKARESYNNFFGLPLTLSEIEHNTKYVVLEMETNRIGGTKTLCMVSLPSMGVITNIAPAHIQDTGGIMGVYEEKKELAESIKEDGVLVLNADNAWVMKTKKATSAKILTFGIKKKGDFFAESIKLRERSTEFFLNGSLHIKLKIPGAHNVYNALAASAVAVTLGVDMHLIKERLGEFEGVGLRMEFFKKGKIRIVNDAYNANPHSVKTALDYLRVQRARRKIFLFGEMHELGEKTTFFHRWVAKVAAKADIDAFFAVGTFSHIAAEEAKKQKIKEVFHFTKKEEAGTFLSSYLKEGDFLLLKASRAMELESILSYL